MGCARSVVMAKIFREPLCGRFQTNTHLWNCLHLNTLEKLLGCLRKNNLSCGHKITDKLKCFKSTELSSLLTTASIIHISVRQKAERALVRRCKPIYKKIYIERLLLFWKTELTLSFSLTFDLLLHLHISVAWK